MPVGGKRPGAGRPKGALSKKTTELAAKLLAEGLTPLEYMLRVMRDETIERATRLDAAKSAAPYIHPRLATVTVGGDPENPLYPDVSTDELEKRAVARLVAAGMATDDAWSTIRGTRH